MTTDNPRAGGRFGKERGVPRERAKERGTRLGGPALPPSPQGSINPRASRSRREARARRTSGTRAEGNGLLSRSKIQCRRHRPSATARFHTEARNPTREGTDIRRRTYACRPTVLPSLPFPLPVFAARQPGNVDGAARASTRAWPLDIAVGAKLCSCAQKVRFDGLSTDSPRMLGRQASVARTGWT